MSDLNSLITYIQIMTTSLSTLYRKQNRRHKTNNFFNHIMLNDCILFYVNLIHPICFVLTIPARMEFDDYSGGRYC